MCGVVTSQVLFLFPICLPINPLALSQMTSFCCREESQYFSCFLSAPYPAFSLQKSLSPKAMKTHFWPYHR